MKRWRQLWSGICKLHPGQSMAEYALIIALVAVVGLTVWKTLGTNIKSTISEVANCIN